MSASPPTDGPTRDVVCLPKMYRALSAHILSAQQLAHEHSQMLASLYVQQVLTSIAAGPAAEYLLAGPSSVGATVSTTTLQVTSTKTNVTTNAARGGRRPSSSPITPGRAAAPAALEGDSAAAQGSGASGKRRLEKSPLGNEYGMWASEAVAAFTGLERSCALLTQHLSNAPRPLVRCAAVATDLAGAAVDASLMAGHASPEPSSLAELLHRAAPASSPEKLARDAARDGDQSMTALLAAAQIIQKQQSQLAVYRRALVARSSLASSAVVPVEEEAQGITNEGVDDAADSVEDTPQPSARSSTSATSQGGVSVSSSSQRTATARSSLRRSSLSPPAVRSNNSNTMKTTKQPSVAASAPEPAASKCATTAMTPAALDAANDAGLIVQTDGMPADDVIKASTFIVDAKALLEALRAGARALAGAAAAEHRNRQRALAAERHAAAVQHLLTISRTAGAWAPASYAASAVNREVDAMRAHYENVVDTARREAEHACGKATRAMKRFDSLRRELESARASVDAAETRAARLADALAATAIGFGATCVPPAETPRYVPLPLQAPSSSVGEADDDDAAAAAAADADADAAAGGSEAPDRRRVTINTSSSPLERLAAAATSPPTSPLPIAPRQRVSVTKQVRREWEATRAVSHDPPTVTPLQLGRTHRPPATRAPADSQPRRSGDLRRDVTQGVVGAGRFGSFAWKKDLRH
jgi:hypothetical protein